VPFDESKRIRFHQWLITHDLEHEVADAILSSMQPFDWHELATRSDIVATRADIVALQTDMTIVRTDVATLQTDVVGLRSDVTTVSAEMIRRFDLTDDRLKGVAHGVRALIFAMMGVIVSVLLAGAASVWA
jgi:hypothetical protein